MFLILFLCTRRRRSKRTTAAASCAPKKDNTPNPSSMPAKFGGGGKQKKLYHHPYTLDSQKVRLALEEKDVDYWPYRMNPLEAKNLDSYFFWHEPNMKNTYTNGGLLKWI